MFTAVPVHTLLVSWYLFISLLTLAAYARDKSAARQMRWRTPESHLHLLALLGGWPGAWLGQRLFRHKTKKTGFRVTFYAMALLNGVGVALLLAWWTSRGA